MKVLIRKWGNSQGVIIPKPILSQLGLESEVEMTIDNNTIVLSRPQKVRQGWAEDSKMIAAMGNDASDVSSFENEFDDKEWVW